MLPLQRYKPKVAYLWPIHSFKLHLLSFLSVSQILVREHYILLPSVVSTVYNWKKLTNRASDKRPHNNIFCSLGIDFRRLKYLSQSPMLFFVASSLQSAI